MKKQIAAGCLICLAVMAGLLLFWNRLPADIPVEYNSRGEVAAVLPKPAVVFGMPAMCALLHVLVISQLQNRLHLGGFRRYVCWIMPVLALVFCAVILIGSL